MKNAKIIVIGVTATIEETVIVCSKCGQWLSTPKADV